MTRLSKTMILLTFIAFSCNSQNSNDTYDKSDADSIDLTKNIENKDTSIYAMPIGTKFTLELTKVSNKEYKYEIVNFLEISYSIDYSNCDTLFEKSPKPETIECYFAKGIDQTGSFKSVLILRNNTKSIINYEALISYEGNKDFYETSVSQLYPGALSSELWNDKLSAIVIRNLTIEK
jgi:hypothetical protein